jgi:hypothetical protein
VASNAAGERADSRANPAAWPITGARRFVGRLGGQPHAEEDGSRYQAVAQRLAVLWHAPDRLSPLTTCPGMPPVTSHPGHSRVRGPRTRLCHPIHHRTTTEPPPSPLREGAAASALTGRGAEEGGDFFERLAAMSPQSGLGRGQRRRAAPAVTAALAAGWTPGALAEFVGGNTNGIRNPGAVLAARLSPSELAPPRAKRRPPWCGKCDQHTRMLDYDGDAPRPCPRCKAPRPATPLGQSHESHALEYCAPPSATGRQRP